MFFCFFFIVDAASFFYFCHLKTSTYVHFCLFVNLSFIEFLFICCYNMKKKNENKQIYFRKTPMSLGNPKTETRVILSWKSCVNVEQ